MQQDLILDKAINMSQSSDDEEKRNGIQAISLITKSRDIKELKSLAIKILYPAEYKIRADALVEARRLVGGVELEKN